jgi:hypothetical protein
MRQPIAGVAPSAEHEATIATVWPSIAVYGLGRALGRWCSASWPNIYILRIGHLFAMLSIPAALWLYVRRVGPASAVRYTLTNRRVTVERGMRHVVVESLELGQFDDIQIAVQPGQAWYAAGDLLFFQSGREVFRLDGVSRPEAFRQVCLKARTAFTSVHRVCGAAAAACGRSD